MAGDRRRVARWVAMAAGASLVLGFTPAQALTGETGVVSGTLTAEQTPTPCVWGIYRLTDINVAGRVPLGRREYQVALATPVIELDAVWAAPDDYHAYCYGYQVQ